MTFSAAEKLTTRRQSRDDRIMSTRHVLPGADVWTNVLRLTAIVLAVLRVHGIGILVVALSFCGVIMARAVRVEVVDSSFFKALGLLLAVLLSLRARNAVISRQKAIRDVLSMINSAESLLALPLSAHKRFKLRVVLEFTFAEIVNWFDSENAGAMCCSTKAKWKGPTFEDLPVEFQIAPFYLVSLHDSGTSPRMLLSHLISVCDTLFDPCGYDESNGVGDKVSYIRRWHKNVDIDLRNILTQFDNLCVYEQELNTKEFRWMLSLLITVYVSLYPWCVDSESTVTLGCTTILMACVYYGMNAITRQVEDPFGHHYQGFDLEALFHKAFATHAYDAESLQQCKAVLAEKSPPDALVHRFSSQSGSLSLLRSDSPQYSELASAQEA